MVPLDRLLAGAKGHRLRTGRPRVTLAYAQSLDGSIALQAGQPFRLSGPQSLKLTHQLRAAHNAILVGIGTVLSDDPQLTVREVKGENPQTVVLDSQLRLPLTYRLMENESKPWVFTAQGAEDERRTQLERRGAKIWNVSEESHGRLDLQAVLAILGRQEVDSLMVEGGAEVITSFLTQGLADLVILTLSPQYLGGVPSVEPGAFQLPKLPRLVDAQAEKVGEDFVIWGMLDK